MDVVMLFGLSVTSLLALLLASPFLRHRFMGFGWLALAVLGWLVLSNLIDLRATTLGLLVSYYSLATVVGVLYIVKPQSRALYWTRLAHGVVAGLFVGHGLGLLPASLFAVALSGWTVLWGKHRQDA
jgi:hypothetical protein